VRKKRVFKRKVIVSETRSDVMVESGIMRSAAFLAAFLAACFFITGTNASPTDQVPPSPTHQKLQNDTSAKIQNDTSAKLSELPSADLQAADPTEEREAYIPGVNTKHSWNPWCLINPIFCILGRNRRDSEAVRADDSNDVMAIKRQKGVAKPKGVFKLICKLFPKILPCKLLGRNRRDFEAVRADDSLPASSTHDIQGPKLRMNYGEEEGERADAGNDAMAIRRQKGVGEGLIKLICKVSPGIWPCKFLGRNRRVSEAVRADDSLPASSSSTHDIQGPKLRMSYSEVKGERVDAGDDVMAIKRQKRSIIKWAKQICKFFPTFWPCKFLGRHHMDTDTDTDTDTDMAVVPVNPSPSNDIEVPDFKMGNAESDVPPSPY